MKSRWLVAACAALLLAGCAGAPVRKAFDRAAAPQAKKVVLVEYPEPEKYRVVGVQKIPTAGGVAMMVLGGAIGGAIVGGIEASYAEEVATSFTAAVRPHSSGFVARLYSRLDAKLRERGYEVMHVERPPKKSADEVVDYTSVARGADMVIEAWPTIWGYRKGEGGFQPMMGVRAQVVGVVGSPLHYAQVVIYGTGTSNSVTMIAPDPRFAVEDLDKLYASGPLAAEALQTGIDEIAARIASDL